MTNNIQWTVIEHSQSSSPLSNLIMVGYRSRGMRLNEVCAVSPLYDLRDMNLDGRVSFTESFWNTATKFKDFEHVFAFIKSMGEMSCVTDAAVQLKDYELWEESMRAALEKVFDIGLESITPSVIQNLALQPIQKALAKAGLNTANNTYGGALFLFKVGLGSDIKQSLISLGSQRSVIGLGQIGH